MPATRVQTKTAPSAGYATSTAVVMDSNFTAGNMVLVAISYNDDVAGTVSTVVDGTNTYTKITSGASGADTTGELWYSYNISAVTSPTVTVTMSANSHDMAVIVREYSGLTTTNPLDKSSGIATSIGTTHTARPVATTSQNKELVVAMLSYGSNSTFTVGAGFSNLANQNASDIFESVALQDKDATSLDDYSATITAGTSSAGYFIIATFKEVIPGYPKGIYRMQGYQ